MEIIKDKQFIKIQLPDKKRPYIIDCNEKVCYGLTGKPLRSFPNCLRSYIEATLRGVRQNKKLKYKLFDTAVYYSTYFSIEEFTTFMSLIDKVNSFLTSATLGDIEEIETTFLGAFSSSYYDLVNFLYSNLLYIKDNFKAFTRAWLEEKNGFAPECWIKNEKMKKVLGDYIVSQFTPGEAEWCYEQAADIKRLLGSYFSDKEISDFFLWLHKDGFLEYSLTVAFLGTSYNFSSIVNSFLLDCKFLNIHLNQFKKIPFYTAVLDTKVLKDVKAGQVVAQFQNAARKKLEYKDENFTVVIPTTKEEFLDEATQQSNCVARVHYPLVAEEECYIVFVRENSAPEVSCVTCEVSKSGEILQYLKIFNKRPDSNTPEGLFRQKYQEHLKQMWEELGGDIK